MNLSVHGVRKSYGRVQALTRIDLALEQGMFGLLGPNGAGKTTLLRILVGLVRADGGSVRVDGKDVTREPGRTNLRRHLGYLPQEFGFYPEMTAAQFLDYMAILKEMDDGSARRRRVREVLDLVGLHEDADRRLKGFSGGMRRRVGIAQALLADPDMLIVDEPTAGLDPEERIRLRNMLAGLATDRLVILSTHIVEDISQTCRNMALLAAGEVAYDGSVANFIDAARGVVWELRMADGASPPTGWTQVAAVAEAGGVRYRLVGEGAPAPNAIPQTASLEDAYVWHMRIKRRTGQ